MALGVNVTFTAKPESVNNAVKKGAFKSLKHAAAAIRKTAVESMVRLKGPSAPGEPPHRHRGRLARSILYAVEGEEAFVGPAYSRMQSGGLPPWVGSIHERGGTYGGGKWRKAAKTKAGKTRKAAVYPARPFMRPAMEQNEERFVRAWRGAID